MTIVVIRIVTNVAQLMKLEVTSSLTMYQMKMQHVQKTALRQLFVTTVAAKKIL